MQVCSSLCPKSQTKLLQQNCSFFQPVKSICSTPKKIPWFPRQCSIVRIPGGQSRSHWNSHSWVSCSESADCDLVSRHIPPLFLTRSPTTSETYIIAFPDLIPFVCLRSVSLPSLKTCSHSTTCLDLVSRHICLSFLTNNNTLPAAHILFAISKDTEEVENWRGPILLPPSLSQALGLNGINSNFLHRDARMFGSRRQTHPPKYQQIHRTVLIIPSAAWPDPARQDSTNSPVSWGPDWLESNDHLASLMQIVRKMRWILGLGILSQKDLALLGQNWDLSRPSQSAVV